MIRVKLQLLADGRTLVTVTLGHRLLLSVMLHVTKAPVTLEVPDE